MTSMKRLYVSQRDYDVVRGFFNTRGTTRYVMTEADAYDFAHALHRFCEKTGFKMLFGNDGSLTAEVAFDVRSRSELCIDRCLRTTRNATEYLYKNRAKINWTIWSMRRDYPEVRQIETLVDAEIFHERVDMPFWFYDENAVPCKIQRSGKYIACQIGGNKNSITYTSYSHFDETIWRYVGDQFIFENRKQINIELAKDKRSVALVYRSGESK